MSLCKKCYGLFKERNCPEGHDGKMYLELNVPWIHCHHEKEIKKCFMCSKHKDIDYINPHTPYSSIQTFKIHSSFCPECGRKLKEA